MTIKKALLIGIILLGVIYWQFKTIKSRNEEINRLEKQIENIRTEAERIKQNEIQICNARNEVKKTIQEDKSGFNWSFNYYNSSPLARLRQKCRSCSNSPDKLY